MDTLELESETQMPNLFVEIVIQENLGESLIIYFEGLQLEKTENNSTYLSGEIPDHPALYGLLERIRDLNLRLVSIQVKSIFPKGSTK